MIERLLENWLDSATERSYQPVFVQILTAQGFRVVHSTRHAALEFGKDVLAVGPDGRGCAYQLKGNPGGRMSLDHFRREIQPQLIQLISQPVVFPGFPGGAHDSFLVSNGYFDEEVQRAVDDINRGAYFSKVSLVSRGDLLTWCRTLGASLWPSELRDTRALLEIFMANPRDLLPIAKLEALLHSILRIGPIASGFSGQAEFDRAIISSALLTGIAASRFSEEENHFATASAWALYAVNAIAASGKHSRPLAGLSMASLRLSETAVGDALASIWSDVNARPAPVEGNLLADPEVYGWRYTLLLGLLTSLALYDSKMGSLLEQEREELHQWLSKSHTDMLLWGEGAVASLFPWLVWMRGYDASLRPEIKMGDLAEAIIRSNQARSKTALASPYYSYEEIALFQMSVESSEPGATIGGETFQGSSFTAEALLHLVVRANLKRRCSRLWADFTRLSHRSYTYDDVWAYCALSVEAGFDVTRIYPSTYQWSELRSDAVSVPEDAVPVLLKERPWLLALWWQLAPHRCITQATHAFIDEVLPGWGNWDG